MKKLKINTKRDAWGTIRGYVYQVDLTIQRWLDLQPNSALELERGEDVDTIHQAMRKRGAAQNRLLEQIKVRDQKLTLRSSAALGALAYFYEHERTNAGLNLSYRYVTNAEITKEHKSPVLSGISLLTLWNQLTNEDPSKKDQSKTLKLIRCFLRSVRKPKNFPAATWKPFAGFVKDAEHQVFDSFIRKVEWLAHQTPTALTAQKIQETLISKYEIPSEQAQTVYSVLFLRVFKLLTQRGIKRLTTAGRDTILAAPQVAPVDQALFANLSIYLTNLSERMNALEEAVSVLQPRALPTASEIREACRKATQRLTAVIVDGRKIIARENLREKVSEFLSSEERYLVVLGPSGVGKSMSAASEADRMMVGGVTVLLARGKYFSLEQSAQLIAQEIWPAVADLSWQKMVEVLTQDQSSDASEFVLVIDAIDEADDLHQLSSQLTKLHDSIGAISPKKVRVILSCRDIAWGRFSYQRLMPLYEDSGTPITKIRKQISGYTSKIIRLQDFATGELDRALQEIGATELINPGRFGETASAHIATLRDMLRHPATFEHYAALRRTNDAISIQEITWSYLINQRLSGALDKAGRECNKSADDLRKILDQLAILNWQAGSKNFELGIEDIETAIPELIHNFGHGLLSPLMALVENRLLSELVVTNNTRIVFHSSDIGAYLLSFELERQAKGKSPQEVRHAFDQWLKESWDFPPLLDALLALLDRLVDQPYGSASLAMIEALVESNRFHNSSIFELMRPEVLKTIFEIIKRANDLNTFYDYRDAALGIRPSPTAVEEIRSHLNDENALARQMAAELAGAHQDQAAIDELIQLLQDRDEDVRDKAYRAFGHIGRPAVAPLLRIINDPTRFVELRSSCMTALRNVGLRTEDVSAALAQSLTQATTSPELINNSLLAAAGLRDQNHSNAAIKALRHQDEQVVLAAAKYLTEVPEPGAFSALQQNLKSEFAPATAALKRSWAFSQSMIALWKTNQAKAAPVILNLVEDAIEGRGELSPFRAIHLSEKVDLPAISRLVFRELLRKLQAEDEKLVWESANVLGETWRTDHLNALIEENQTLADQGVESAKLFVDATIPGMQGSEEFRIGDRLNRVSDLSTLIKCQAKNFAPEATRLFDHSGVLSCMKLSDLLWVCGDTRAETALIRRFENPSQEREASHERSYVARALGTCGDTKGAHTVLNHLRERGEELLDDFGQTTLYPLLTRELLSFDELNKVARDPKMNWWSRAVTLIALSLTDSKKFGELFADVAVSASGQPRLQAQAVRLLGLAKDRSVLSLLHHFLGKSEHSSVKAEAAECLAWLEDTSSVHAIERALENSPAPGFALALAHFHQESSLPILLDHLAAASFQWKPVYLQALAAFWKYPEGKAAVLDQFDRWSDPEERYLNNQGALITGLVEHEPDVILDQFNKSFDDGYVTTGARETMARALANLFYRKHPNEPLLLKTAKRLLSDKHVSARERAGHALGFASTSFCLRLYGEMHDSLGVSEWERASSVYSLGFWESPLALIKAARYDEELLVRYTADAALDIRLKKPHLERHFEQYNTQGGMARLSSYLCLAEQGDQSTIWALNDNKKTSPFARTFRKRLYKRIERRLADEYKKKLEEERKLPDSRGAITFD
jgi:HEAT repeat protein